MLYEKIIKSNDLNFIEKSLKECDHDTIQKIRIHHPNTIVRSFCESLVYQTDNYGEVVWPDECSSLLIGNLFSIIMIIIKMIVKFIIYFVVSYAALDIIYEAIF